MIMNDPIAESMVKLMDTSPSGYGSPYERHRKGRVRRQKQDAKARARSRRRMQRDSRRKNRGKR